MWGFDHFDGPSVALQQVPGSGWRIVPASGKESPDTLIVGQPNHLKLIATGTACVQSIALQPGDAKVDWKLNAPPKSSDTPPAPKPSPNAAPVVIPPKTEPIDLTLSLAHDTAPGSIHLAIHQFGEADPDIVAATAFVEPARIETLLLHAGDSSATLTGTSLDQVKSLTLKDLTYTPLASASSIEADKSGKALTLALAKNTTPPALKPNDRLTAEVHLRDGRTLPISTLILAPRPAVTILSRHVAKTPPSPIALAKNDDLALGSELDFFLKSRSPFPRTGKIEIASDSPGDPSAQPTDSLHTTLSVAAGSLVLQDAHTILATFDPLKTFGPSTFGPFHLRPIAADGTVGEWLPLATIVRLPTLTSLTCPADATAPCTLAGSGLYLIDAVSLDSAFTNPTKVPEGFVDTTLAIPHPGATTSSAVFYLRLRDDPSAAQQVTLNIQPDTPPPPPAHTHSSRSTPAPAAATTPPPETAPTATPAPEAPSPAPTPPPSR